MINPLSRGEAQKVDIVDGDVVILCEGFDECALVSHLTEGWTKKPKFGTKSDEVGLDWEGEFRNLGLNILKRSSVSLGFMFDAEQSREVEFAKLVKRCKLANIDLPDNALETAVHKIADRTVTTAYILNPHGKEKGSIDTLFRSQVEASPRWACIQELLKCYGSTGETKENEDKVAVRTYLAHSQSNTGINAAIRSRALSIGGSEFNPVRQFLKNLCEGKNA